LATSSRRALSVLSMQKFEKPFHRPSDRVEHSEAHMLWLLPRRLHLSQPQFS
jgi:hypothetical protein